MNTAAATAVVVAAAAVAARDGAVGGVTNAGSTSTR